MRFWAPWVCTLILDTNSNFDAAVVFVTNSLILFSLALAILCYSFCEIFWCQIGQRAEYSYSQQVHTLSWVTQQGEKFPHTQRRLLLPRSVAAALYQSKYSCDVSPLSHSSNLKVWSFQEHSYGILSSIKKYDHFQ